VWFDHKPERFEEFTAKYTDELTRNSAVDQLKELLKTNSTVTLLYAAKDPQVNHAVVLRDFLDKKA